MQKLNKVNKQFTFVTRVSRQRHPSKQSGENVTRN